MIIYLREAFRNSRKTFVRVFTRGFYHLPPNNTISGIHLTFLTYLLVITIRDRLRPRGKSTTKHNSRLQFMNRSARGCGAIGREWFLPGVSVGSLSK